MCVGVWAAIFNGVIKVGVTEKVTFEQSPKGGDAVN